MLLIFWDIKEKPEAKKKIAKQLSEVEEAVNQGNQKVAKVIFTDGNNIRELNRTYRKLDKETDVLSFAELDFEKNSVGTRRGALLQEDKTLGEIYINYDWIKKDTRTITELFIHGYLHLLGYDHEKDRGEMEKLEKSIKNKIIGRI